MKMMTLHNAAALGRPSWTFGLPLMLLGSGLSSPAFSQSGADAPAAVAEQASGEAQENEGDAKEEEENKLPNRGPVKVEGTLPLDWVDEIEWRSIGPANMGGRITDIAVNPDDLSEVWFGTATGGVVHTKNRGITYEHQFGKQRVSSIGAIAVAPSEPTHVWVGTGEANPRNSTTWGDGVYVSHDSGATWKHAGLEKTFQISTVVVHPEDPNTVYVGALGRLWGPNEERGLYKTTDGGQTWEQIHYVDEDTGVIEVKMHPTDPDTIVIATYERRRDMFDTNDPAVKWGDGGGIFRTTDGGETWEQLTEGLPTGELGRVGMNWSVSNPDHLYAVVETDKITQEPENAAWFGIEFDDAPLGAKVAGVTEDSPAEAAGLEEGDIVLRIADTAVLNQSKLRRVLRDYFAGDTATIEVVRDGDVVPLEITFDSRPVPEEDQTDVHGRMREGPFGIGLGGQRANAQDEQGPEGFEYGGIFKSTDRGDTWTRINSLNPRPMYYSEIRVDPSDENYVYVLGTRLYRSEDGGETFTRDGHDGSVHVDHHALWIDPTNGKRIILGNDGGIYVTEDRMKNWDHHNKLALGQFYNVTAGPRTFYNVYGGLQDNGSWGGPSRTGGSGATNEAWVRVGGGDGFRCLVDPNNPDLVYYESQNGGMGRRDFATGQGGFLRPRAPRGSDERYRFNWNTPFILSAFNSSIYYSAGNYVFRSIERGENQRRISPDITATERGAAVALAESPRDQDVLYVGTDDGALWMTESGGEEWIDLMALNGEPAFNGGADEQGGERRDITTEESAQRALLVAVRPEDGKLAGTWTCKAEGDGVESSNDGKFTLTFEVDDKGKVSGKIDSDVGEGELERVRWKESSGELSFRFAGETLTMDFASKVDLEKGTMSGTIEAAGGAFEFDFSGTHKASKSSKGSKVARNAAKEASKASTTAEVVELDTQDPDSAGGQEGEEAAEEQEEEDEQEFVEDTIDQLLPKRLYVSDIKPSRFDRERVYATFDGHRSDDTHPYLFVSEDLGRSWTSLRSNLPNQVGSVRAILEDANNENVLYIGTEHGIYVSIDRGESWTRFNSNLPTVPVHDLAQHTEMGELVAGTHGRSVWIVDNSVIGQITEATMEDDAFLFEPNDVHLRARSFGTGRAGNHGFTATNPYQGATISYAINDRARSVKLEILNGRGDVVATPDAPSAQGFHSVRWNLRGQAAGGQANRFRRGRRAQPGIYVARLTVDGTTQSKSFEIHNDPAQPTTEWIGYEDEEEALQALFEANSAESERD